MRKKIASSTLPGASVNRIFREHGHQFIYDFETMATILKKVGFIEVTKACFGEGGNTSLILDTPSWPLSSCMSKHGSRERESSCHVSSLVYCVHDPEDQRDITGLQRRDVARTVHRIGPILDLV